jgi:Uma2 family endonuclease
MQQKIHSAPTLVYPSSDGKPMAETDKHRKLMVDFIQMLEHHFREVNNVYVSGNLLIYYEEGNPRRSIAPDVFVVFGVGKKPRRTYLTWEEGSTPDFVLEVASPSTYQHDFGPKKKLYASVLAVKEYYIYDPYQDITPSFIGYQLVDEKYQEIAFAEGRLPSSVLGLELGEHEGDLRLYDPATQQWLQPPEKRAEQAEAELAEALAEFERLRTKP